MIIVAGQIPVEPEQREAYLQGCVEVIEQARNAPGCLDFALTADLVAAGRIDVVRALGIGRGGPVLSRRRSQPRAPGRNDLSLSVRVRSLGRPRSDVSEEISLPAAPRLALPRTAGHVAR
jgi:Antibiotic biosynthesis monooxygenase